MKTIYTCDALGKISKDKWITRLRKLQERNDDNFITNAYFDEDADTLYWEMQNDSLPDD